MNKYLLTDILKGKGCLIDTEFNNIKAYNADKCWCVSLVDLQTKEQFEFRPSGEGEDQFHDQFATDLKKKLEEYDYFVGHHFWGAEYPILKNLIGFTPKPEQVIDTLVLSRAQRPQSPFAEHFGKFRSQGLDTRIGGHSLAAWGKRLGFSKIDFNDFTRFSEDMMIYCHRDTDLNVGVFEYLLKEKEKLDIPDEFIWVEHESHRLLTLQTENGFKLHAGRAKELYERTSELIDEYLNELHKVFPPKKKLVEVYTPRFKKDGDMTAPSFRKLQKSMYEENEDGTYNIYTMVEFNPGSPQQVGERLIDLGWNPQKFTATGQPSTDKATLESAVDFLSKDTPEVEVLRKYNIVQHRNSLSREWLELAKEAGDGRVRGSINHIGPWTHRCSHFKPNMANVPSVAFGPDDKPLYDTEGNFGWEARHSWVAEDGKVLVGVDASGIQLRALAHYINDATYIKEVCEGDIHVVNQKAAGIKDRPTAKTFIYCWLLGGGDEKVGQIVGVDNDEYETLFSEAQNTYKWNWFRHKSYQEKRTEYDNLLWWVSDRLRKDERVADRKTVATILKGFYTKKKFLENIPALKNFKEVDIKEAAKQGFMIGLDGRKIWVPSEHLAMGAYLQGFEATIMKWAMVWYHHRLESMQIPFKQVDFVHDEFVVETLPEYAETVLEVVKQSIPEVGKLLGSKCPLDSDGRIGESWAVVH